MKRAIWLVETGLAVILSVPLAILPFGWSVKAGAILGLLLFYLWKSRRRIAIENLARAVANGSLHVDRPVESIIRDAFRNLGRSAAEVVKIYYGHGRNAVDAVRIDGYEHFAEARRRGKGVIFITGHCGNWELLAIAASIKLSPLAVIARRIDNSFVNGFVERVRRKYGNTVIYKKGALKRALQELKRNACIGILMDQAVIPEEGYVIDFLGRGAWTTKMPALIARKTEAAVLPAFIHREGDSHRITIFPAVKLSDKGDTEQAVREDTERFSSFIEEYIRRHPDEWLWIHRRWKRVDH